MKFAPNSASNSLGVVSGSHPTSLLEAYKAVTSGTFPFLRIHSTINPCAYARESMEIVENL